MLLWMYFDMNYLVQGFQFKIGRQNTIKLSEYNQTLKINFLIGHKNLNILLGFLKAWEALFYKKIN